MDRSAVLATKIRTAFAPCSLAEWPTPLDEEPSLARALGLQALWLKREDKSGGNKVRGLEFLLAGAPPQSVFVTIGGAGHDRRTARDRRHRGRHRVWPGVARLVHRGRRGARGSAHRRQSVAHGAARAQNGGADPSRGN